jgi:hypothetical protein
MNGLCSATWTSPEAPTSDHSERSSAASGAGGVSASTGIPAATSSRIATGVTGHGTATTTTSGRPGPATSSLIVRTVGTPQVRSISAPRSAVRVTTADTVNRSGRSRAIRTKNSARQPLPTTPKRSGLLMRARLARPDLATIHDLIVDSSSAGTQVHHVPSRGPPPDSGWRDRSCKDSDVRRLAATTLALALLLAGCAGTSKSDATASPTETSAASATASPADVAALDAVKVAGDAGAQPTFTFAQPFTVASIVSRLIGPGTGADLVDGQILSVHYYAVNGTDGTDLGTSYGATTVPHHG